jgi:transposase
MYIRKKTSPRNPNAYIQLVRSYRINKTVKQEVIRHIGTAKDPQQESKLMNLAQQLKNLYDSNKSEYEIEKFYQKEIIKIDRESPRLFNTSREFTKVLGIHDIYGKVFDEMQISDCIELNHNYAKVLKNIVMAKILSPASKRKTAEIINEKFGIEHNLNCIYRMMDKIDASSIERIQKNIAAYNTKLIGKTITVLYYDVTTIYFESFTEDELKKLGFSKDHKSNQPQLILTMLISEQGLPLGYQLLPGNTYEGNTLISAINCWRKQYKKHKFVLVADSGLLNNANIEHLENEGINYIICARIKNLPKLKKQEILDFKSAQDNNTDWFFKKAFKNNRTLIISYRTSRAIKNKMDREKNLEKIFKKLSMSKNPSNFINNFGYKKYITVDSSSEVQLNSNKIAMDEEWDGLHGIITNLNDASSEDVYAQYRGLWRIEDAFRINKTDLKIRPIFHWTPTRIQSHIAISYITYACYKAVEHIIKDYGLNLSHRVIKDILEGVTASIVRDKHTQDLYFCPDSISPQAKEIYKVFGSIPEEDPYCCTGLQ